MIKLIIALTASFLVVVFYFFGLKWGLGVSAILLVAAPYIAFTILKIAKIKATTGGASTSPKTKEFGWVIWPIIILTAIAITWGITASQCKKAEEDRLAEMKSRINTVHPAEEWVFSWELPQGYYVRGLNKGGPMVAEIIPRNDESLWIDTPYKEDGKPERTRMRLMKIGDKSWDGYWEQENPKDGGHCDLHEVAPGVLAGSMQGTTAGIPPAFCKLQRK